jgi:hypothetical protein
VTHLRALSRAPFALLAVLALPATLVAACSAQSNKFVSTTTAFGGGGTGGTVSTSTTTATGTGGDVLMFDGGLTEAAACNAQCSSDFHTVLDCNGMTIMTCTGANGCDSTTGTCANACQAAVNNKQAIGCEYYATDMDQYQPNYCFAAFVANTWNTPVHINVDFNGTTLPIANFARIPSGAGPTLTYGAYDATAGLMPGEVAILFLAGTEGTSSEGNPLCPAPTAMPTTMAQLIQSTGLGHSFHITTDVPVVAYEINPYGGGSAAVTGASLLLPTSSWDTNYVAVTVSPQDIASPSMNIIASVDNTHVTMLPKVAVTGGGGLPAGPANTQYLFTLNKGQMAQFTQAGDLTGSIIQSDQPIGFMAGQPCERAPLGTAYCDHGEQMVPPVKALGSEYAAVMHRARVNGDQAIWHLVGAVDGTTLTYTPSTPTGAPLTLTAGQVVDFTTATPFVVSSQDGSHPFMLFEYMTGSQWSGLSNKGGYGDADFVISVPTAQYLSAYVFFSDPTYPETNLVVIRRPNKQMAFDDVTLDCAGVLTGWQPVGSYEYTRIDLSTGNFLGQNGCNNGAHKMTSTSPFGLWVWGWGTPLTSSFTANVSYGYPGGMNVQPINTVVIPPMPQ